MRPVARVRIRARGLTRARSRVRKSGHGGRPPGHAGSDVMSLELAEEFERLRN
jgi:hypothetical protein